MTRLFSLFLALAVLAGCDSQAPDLAGSQQTAPAVAQSSSMVPWEIQINTDQTATIRDVVNEETLLAPKQCAAVSNQVRIQADGQEAGSPCSLRYVNNVSFALMYFPNTERPYWYTLNNNTVSSDDVDVVLDYNAGQLTVINDENSVRVESGFLDESLVLSNPRTTVRGDGRKVIDVDWAKTFRSLEGGVYDLDHGLLRTQYRRKGTTTWHTRNNNVSATSGTFRITPSPGTKTFEFRLYSLLTGHSSPIIEHQYVDPQTTPGTVDVQGPSAVQTNEFNSWSASVTPPSGASEVSRTWDVDDGNGVVFTTSDQDLVYVVSSEPDNPVGYHIILNVTFSDGSTVGDLHPLEVTDGGCPNGGLGCGY